MNCPRIGAVSAWALLVGGALAIACHGPPEVAESASLRYRYDEHVSFIAGDRYEHYDQEDWQFDGLGVTRLTSDVRGLPLLGTNNDVFLRNGLEDYEAHLFSLSFVYEL